MKSLAEVLADTLVLGIGPMARLWPLAKLLEMATRERERERDGKSTINIYIKLYKYGPFSMANWYPPVFSY